MFNGVHGSSDIRTYVSNTGSIQPTGGIRDLGVEQIAFLRVDKRGVGIKDQAQIKPTARTSPYFKLAIGRAEYDAQSALQPNEGNLPFITREIRGKNIVKWQGTKANSQSTTDVWALGYDGVDARKRLSGVIDDHELKIGIRLWGGPIKKLTGEAPFLQRWYHVDKGCIDRCLDICETNPGLADEYIADNILKKFRADKFGEVPISRFVKATKLRKAAVADDPIVGLLTATEYTLPVYDDGSYTALGAVQSQYSGYKVEQVERFGAKSTYRVWRPNTVGAPADFVNTQPLLLSVCGVCPSGYTLVNPETVYTIARPLAPTTDLTTPAAQQTYANTIGTAYANSGRGIATLGGANGTGYGNGTFPLIFANGGGSGAEGTVTVAGGVITARTITKKGSGYTSAPTITAPGVTGGTGATFTATIDTAPTATSTFIAANSGVATVTVRVPVGTAPLVALTSDELFSVNTTSAYCQPPTGASVAWVTTGRTSTVAPKQWMLTLEDSVCGNSRLPEVQNAYRSLVVAEQGLIGECARIYVTTNYSEPFIAEECTIADYVYNRPDSFFDGAEWIEFKTPLAVPVCTTEEDDVPCVAAGIRFETAAFVHHTKECLYGYYSYDLNDVDPVYMEITAHTEDWTAAPCYKTDQVVTKLRETKFATGKGALIREAEHATLLHYGKSWSSNLARNDAYGVYFNAKPDLWYDTYRLTVESNEFQNGINGKEGTKQLMTYVFAFPTGMGKGFETLMNGYILSLDNEDLTPVIL